MNTYEVMEELLKETRQTNELLTKQLYIEREIDSRIKTSSFILENISTTLESINESLRTTSCDHEGELTIADIASSIEAWEQTQSEIINEKLSSHD